MVLDLEVTGLDIQLSLEPLLGVVGCPGQEVELLVCVLPNPTAHHEIVQIRNWSSEDLPLKGVSVSSCSDVGRVQYCLERICS